MTTTLKKAHQAAQEGWGKPPPPHTSLQRTSGEHAHSWHHRLVWQHHPGREEGSPGGGKVWGEDHWDQSPIIGHDSHTALQEKRP